MACVAVVHARWTHCDRTHTVWLIQGCIHSRWASQQSSVWDQRPSSVNMLVCRR